MTIAAIYELKNLPRRTLDGTLSNTIKGEVAQFPAGKYIQISCGGWTCCSDLKYDDNPEQVAVTMARVIELALDAGFEQGRAYIRRSMGIKEG